MSFAGVAVGVGGEARAGAAGLLWPQGDPEELRAAARQAGAAAGLLRAGAQGLGARAGAVAGWRGEAAQSFGGAVERERDLIDRAATALEDVAGALDRLAQVVENAREEVLEQASKVEAAEEETRLAESREAAESLVAAGAGAALDLFFGEDPPRALQEAKRDAEEDAERAGRGAVAAREREAAVRRRAEARAREAAQEVIREDRTTADAVESAEIGGAAGSGFGIAPGAAFTAGVVKRMTVSDFKELAFLNAGIDATAWNPREGLDANDESVRAVYAYYRELGLAHGEFQWMKLAALGGPLFYAGFEDLDFAGDRSLRSGDELDFVPWGLGMGSDDLRAYEGQFLRIQKAIFSDLAWQHEAFLLGGAAAVRAAVSKLPERQRDSYRKTLRAWDAIESADPRRVKAGNYKLVEREQGPVIQRYYEEMLARPSGEEFTGRLTDRAEAPIPGAKDYRDFSEQGNIANYPDRIKWIENDIWEAHQRLLARPGAVEAILHRDFDSEVWDRRHLPKDLAPPLTPITPPPIPGIG